MTVKDIIEQIEISFGRQSEKYIMRLINDGLNELASKRQHNIKYGTPEDLKYMQRWYDIPSAAIDIVKVEIKDTSGRYTKIPKLVNSHVLLKDDTDATTDSLV